MGSQYFESNEHCSAVIKTLTYVGWLDHILHLQVILVHEEARTNKDAVHRPHLRNKEDIPDESHN